MSKQCDIVRDILPLYVDGACSEASAEMVKEHLNACADCNAIYQNCFLTRAKMFFTKKAKALLCAMRQKKSREAEKR